VDKDRIEGNWKQVKGTIKAAKAVLNQVGVLLLVSQSRLCVTDPA